MTSTEHSRSYSINHCVTALIDTMFSHADHPRDRPHTLTVRTNCSRLLVPSWVAAARRHAVMTGLHRQLVRERAIIPSFDRQSNRTCQPRYKGPVYRFLAAVSPAISRTVPAPRINNFWAPSPISRRGTLCRGRLHTIGSDARG